MLFILIINLYTSRVVLSTLGVVDYGVYNVVGGVIGMFYIVTTSLSNSIGRFFNFSLGKDDTQEQNIVFCTSVNIQILMSIVVFVLTELIGVWFLNNKMNIPENRMVAANYVLQFSIINFVIELISVPYNALIIAHEKMGAFAYISIFEVVFKLTAILVLTIVHFDKLILWAFSLMIISIIIRIIYGRYSGTHFPECKYRFIVERKLLKKMGVFAGWSFIGEAAGILRNQGVNILLNLYYGPVVNAANAIAMQVNGVISQFAGNFNTAVNPQIIKSYAANNLNESFNLVKVSTRLSFFLMLILSAPIIVETEFILKLWLGNFPNYSAVFVKLILILSLIEILCYPIITLQRATGVMRDYQIVSGTIHLLNFPVAWIFLKMGFKPYIVFNVAIALAVINLFARLIMLKRIVPISIKDFCVSVLLKVVFVSISTALFYSVLLYCFKINPILQFLILLIIVCSVVLTIGLSRSERIFILSIIKKKI